MILNYFTGLKNCFGCFRSYFKRQKRKILELDIIYYFQVYIGIHNLLVNANCGNSINIKVLPRPKQNCHCTACCKKIVKYSSAKLKSVSNSMFQVAIYLVPKSEIEFKLITALSSIYDTFSKRWFLFWLCLIKFHTFHLRSQFHSQSQTVQFEKYRFHHSMVFIERYFGCVFWFMYFIPQSMDFEKYRSILTALCGVCLYCTTFLFCFNINPVIWNKL